MPSLLDALAYDFFRHAVVAGVLAAALCGVVGTFVVVKRLAFVSGGISHAAFGGLGVCYFLWLDPILGAVAVSLLSALLLGLVDTERLKAQDALIGVLWRETRAASCSKPQSPHRWTGWREPKKSFVSWSAPRGEAHLPDDGGRRPADRERTRRP